MKPLRLLLVEDSKNDALLILREFSKSGYQVTHEQVKTKQAMEKALASKDWDLVISDHQMPCFSAPEALQVSNNSRLEIPFIILSGNIDEELVVAAMKAGAQDYIAKGSLSRLIPAVERELQDFSTREKKQEAEDSLRLREQEFQTLSENSPDIVARFDRQLRHLYINPVVEKYTDIPREKYIGKANEELGKSPRIASIWNEAVEEVFRTAKEKNLYFDYGTPGGKIYFHARLVPEFSLQGDVKTVLSIARDITDIKIAEEILQQENIRAKMLHFRTLPDSLPSVEGLDMATYYQPARKLNGDIYNAIKVNHNLVLYVTDIQDQGLNGVMQSIFVKQNIEQFLDSKGNSEDSISPTEILAYLKSQHDKEEKAIKCLMSVFLAVVDLNLGQMNYIASNFNGAAFISFRDEKNKELEIGSKPSYAPTNDCFEASISEMSIKLLPGATFLLSTDGLVRKCKAELKDSFARNASLPPEIVSNQVIQDCFKDSEEPLIRNDITVLLLKWLGDEQRLAIEVESHFDTVVPTVEKVHSFIKDNLEVDVDLLFFHELLVNAIEHGNKFDGAKKVFVEVLLTKSYYKISITDQGDGFKWRNKISKELDPENFFERGRGIIMSRMMCDYLGYNEKGNKVTISKLLS